MRYVIDSVQFPFWSKGSNWILFMPEITCISPIKRAMFLHQCFHRSLWLIWSVITINIFYLPNFCHCMGSFQHKITPIVLIILVIINMKLPLFLSKNWWLFQNFVVITMCVIVGHSAEMRTVFVTILFVVVLNDLLIFVVFIIQNINLYTSYLKFTLLLSSGIFPWCLISIKNCHILTPSNHRFLVIRWVGLINWTDELAIIVLPS